VFTQNNFIMGEHYIMTSRKILREVLHIDTETVRAVIGAALLRGKNDARISVGALAERLGRTDDKTASSYISGTTEMGITSLFKGAIDADLGAHIRQAIGDLLGCNLVPRADADVEVTTQHIMPLADILQCVVKMVHPASDGGVSATDAELIANSDAIDDAGLAVDEMRVALSAARARQSTRPVVRAVRS
jgi:hypothetical protein